LDQAPSGSLDQPNDRGGPTSGYLARHRLIEWLDDSAGPLVLVIAPSGFGKTSLLEAWAAETQAEVAWFACSGVDVEPSRFWRRFIGVLATRWPEIGNDAALLLARPSWEPTDVIAALRHDLAEADLGPSAIVIDDAQRAEPTQSLLAQLATSLPDRFRMILASQHNVVFSTSRLRVSGLVTELRARELAFSPDESDELLDRAGLALPSDSRRQLHILTQGWPVGLRLAVIALKSAADPNSVLASFQSTSQEVSDYLANEVIDRLPQGLADFMTKISVLSEFDAALCLDLTEQDDAEGLLQQVIDGELFISPSGAAVGRFQFHPMFAGFLQARLRSGGVEGFAAVHRRAIEILRDRGDVWGAMHHALLLDDVQQAATLLASSLIHSLEVDDATEARDVAHTWLNRFGLSALEADVGQLLQVLLVLTTFGVREAEAWLAAIEDAHPTLPPGEMAVAQGAWGDYFLARGDSDRCLQHNRLAEAAVREAIKVGPVFPRLAELPLQAVGAHLLVGDVAAAVTAVESPSLVPHPTVDEVRNPTIRGWLAFLNGDLAFARRSLEQGRHAAVEHSASATGLGWIFLKMLSGAGHMERLELAEAATAFAEVAEAAEANGRPIIQSLVGPWLARLATAQGNHGAALAAVAQARVVLAEPGPSAIGQLDLAEFRVAVALQPDIADRLLPLLPKTPEATLLKARLMIGRQAADHATRLLMSMEPTTLRQRVEWGVLCGLAHRERDRTTAHQRLKTALMLAHPHGYLASIIEQGTGISELLQSLAAGPTLSSYVDQLVLAAETRSHTAYRSVPSAIHPLSERELTVLGLLASRLTTAEIARTLFISPNTLKSHIKSIYRKLDASSRSEAVYKGQEQGQI
jgi:LuxR family transcriptional regulator, maltose regulon positive regulatory protein